MDALVLGRHAGLPTWLPPARQSPGFASLRFLLSTAANFVRQPFPPIVMAGRSPGHPRPSARTTAAGKPRFLYRHGRRRPTIHEFACGEYGIAHVPSTLPRPRARQDVDARDKPGHDD